MGLKGELYPKNKDLCTQKIKTYRKDLLNKKSLCMVFGNVDIFAVSALVLGK